MSAQLVTRSKNSYVTLMVLPDEPETLLCASSETTIALCSPTGYGTVPIDDLMSKLLVCADLAFHKDRARPERWRVWAKYLMLWGTLRSARGERFFISDVEYLTRQLSETLRRCQDNGYLSLESSLPIPHWSHWPSSSWLVNGELSIEELVNEQASIPGGHLAIAAAGLTEEAAAHNLVNPYEVRRAMAYQRRLREDNIICNEHLEVDALLEEM